MIRIGNTLSAAVKEVQTVAPDGGLILDLIDGVRFLETNNIVTRNGITTELHRCSEFNVQHMIHVVFRPNAIAAWNLHMSQTDHLFATMGTLRVVLFDDRLDSSSRGKLNVIYLTPKRPALLVIPPGVWHGVQNIEAGESGFLNFFDNAYSHDDPDNWRLPFDSDVIPYKFK